MLTRCTSVRPGEKLVEIQNRIWGDLGVQINSGRRAVNSIEQWFSSESAELLELREEFSKAVDAAYLRCLEDRRPATLERKGKISKTIVLEFLDACHVKFDLPEVRDRLRVGIRESGAMPQDVVNDLHGEIMELLGFERAHGLSCFQQMGTSQTFQNDPEVATAYGRWRGKTGNICLMLLQEFRKSGGDLHVDDEVKGKLLKVQAKEGLDAMTMEERTALLEKHAKKVNVFRGLPADARKRHMDRLSENERLELVQAEILMLTVQQLREQQATRINE